MTASEKLCPACNTTNEETASVCGHCGALLEDNPTRIVALPANPDGQASAPVEKVEPLIDVAQIPEDGVGIYVAGAFRPYYLHVYKELIIGRPGEAALESTLDLSDLGAFNMGVSRRHALIRRAESGFEVMDLGSRNGTWLNAERLLPNKPYPFPSGSQLRIGQMRLLVVYPAARPHARTG